MNYLAFYSHFLLNCSGFALNTGMIIRYSFKDEEEIHIVSARN